MRTVNSWRNNKKKTVSDTVYTGYLAESRHVFLSFEFAV